MHFILKVLKERMHWNLSQSWLRIFQLALVIAIYCFIYWYTKKPEQCGTTPKRRTPIILWWNIDSDFVNLQECTSNTIKECIFTKDRSKLPLADVVIFDPAGNGFMPMPLPRIENQLWMLFSRGSPMYNLHYSQTELLQHFNFSATFSRFSHVVLDWYIPGAVTNVINSQSLKAKNKKRYSLAPIVFIEFNCKTATGRTEYVRELMTYIDIDSYGSCLYNRKPPNNVISDFRNKSYTTELFAFFSSYKFMLIIEDIVCDDYITEKYWMALGAGVVPIYFGSPTIADFSPDENSVIYITDYESPKALAEYLHKVDRNDKMYNRYLRYKQGKIENIFLRMLMKSNQNALPWTSGISLMNQFGCKVCNILMATMKGVQTIPVGVNRAHYDCPTPLVQLPVKEKSNSIYQWSEMKYPILCETKVLDYFFRSNRRYTLKEYEKAYADLCHKIE